MKPVSFLRPSSVIGIDAQMLVVQQEIRLRLSFFKDLGKEEHWTSNNDKEWYLLLREGLGRQGPAMGTTCHEDQGPPRNGGIQDER
jgi:hypothetical protein